MYEGEYDVPDGELSSIIGATSDSSASLEPQNTGASISRRTLKVSNATGIPTHVMLLADMQKVIQAQHIFLFKMKNIINEEFDKRQVGHATFQVQKQVESMLSTFQDKIIQKVDAISTNKTSQSGMSGPGKGPNPFGGTDHGGRWFFWRGAYRRVPEDWVFPNKMTLRTAWHRYFLMDHESGVCPLKYLTATDLKK